MPHIVIDNNEKMRYCKDSGRKLRVTTQGTINKILYYSNEEVQNSKLKNKVNNIQECNGVIKF